MSGVKIWAMSEGFRIDQGNYHGYYKKRGDVFGDHRLEWMRKEWFVGKSCLDIGCNDGQFTIAMAKHFLPHKVLGVDIDKHLIESACARVKRLKYDLVQSKGKEHHRDQSSTPANPLFRPRSVIKKLDKAGSSSEKPKALNTPRNDFPHNIQFQQQDVFSLAEMEEARFDTILCLSVTKWIHLNSGDDGLLNFFRLVHGLLRDNGILILEYQPWRSYEKRKNMNTTIQSNFSAIRIRPESFEEVLTTQLNFELLSRLGPTESEARGFNRPILVVRKKSMVDLAVSDSSINDNDHIDPSHAPKRRRLALPP